MNEPQVWTLIGVFAAALFGTLTVISTMLTTMMRDGFENIRHEMGSLQDGLRGEMGSLQDGLRGEMGSLQDGLRRERDSLRREMLARFETVETRFDRVDRDVQALMSRVFPETG